VELQITNYELRITSWKLPHCNLPLLIFLTFYILLLTSRASAIPSFSLLTGTRCSACHYNPQGGGLRTQLGWEMMNETGIIKWPGTGQADTSSDTSIGPPSNSFFNGLVPIGGDARFQLVRVSHTNQELLIPMQLSLSMGFVPSHEIAVYGDINLASLYVRYQSSNNPLVKSGLYPGETDYDLAIQYEPRIDLPSIRAGMIEPSISIRQDDHTLFAHEEAAINGIALIPPYYNEMGAELTYEGLRWLTVNAGVFNSYNLSQIDPTIGTIKSNFDFKHPSVSARIVLWPQLIDQGLNGELGGSILANGSFSLLNGFAGIGLADKASFFIEGLYCKNSANRIVRNFSVIGKYQLAAWLATEWRYDWGQTEVYPGQALAFANAFLVGLEFYPLPYIEIRPEYRVTQTTPLSGTGTYTGQWTGQIHFFY